MRKLILLIVVLAVIAVGWFLYFRGDEEETKVSICEVKFMDVENSLEFSGEVAPQEMYSVMSETGGTIKSLYVFEGSKVNVGDPLFDFDKTDVESMLEEAALNYDILVDSTGRSVMAQPNALDSATKDLQSQKAKVAHALSQTTGYDFESFNSAFSSYIDENAASMAAALSDVSLEDMYSMSEKIPQIDSLILSDNEIALAELSIKKLESMIDRMSYKSLIEGTVIAVNFNRGEVLSPGIPAMVIADTQDTIINAYVYEKDVNDLIIDMDVKIDTDDGIFFGIVSKIGKAAAGIGDVSAFETMTKVEITPIENFDKMPGAIVDLEIILSGKSNVLALSLDCLIGKSSVFVVGEDDIVEKRKITTGFEDTFNVEILSGLTAGERVIISPKGIEEGQKVVYD